MKITIAAVKKNDILRNLNADERNTQMFQRIGHVDQ